ncbi:MAG: hypothetical protein AB1546_04415 [bacterium]
MMRRTGFWAVMFLAVMLMFIGGLVGATPSTTYWTPCVMDVQPAGVWHLTYDNYSNRSTKDFAFTNLLGLTYGVKLSKDANMELGFDWFSDMDYPFFFNAKLGIPEGKLSPNSPGISLGIFNIGTKKNITNQNVIHFVVGKTVEKVRLHGGYYTGNDDILVSSNGDKEDDGFMFGFDYGFNPVEDADGTYNKYVIAGDYASGDNLLGGGGVGLYWYFTRNASLLVGPVWYNDQGINGKVKWTTQLDINF